MPRMTRGSSGGFTVLELMAVVTILGILCAVALASYGVYIKQARTSEAVLNVHSIMSLELGRPGGPIACEASPAEVPGVRPALWEPSAGFRELGFSPGSDTRFQYEVVVPGPTGAALLVRARGDQDGDGEESLFELRSDSPDLRVEGEVE